jgi:hypothetical protein
MPAAAIHTRASYGRQCREDTVIKNKTRLGKRQNRIN